MGPAGYPGRQEEGGGWVRPPLFLMAVYLLHGVAAAAFIIATTVSLFMPGSLDGVFRSMLELEDPYFLGRASTVMTYIMIDCFAAFFAVLFSYFWTWVHKSATGRAQRFKARPEPAFHKIPVWLKFGILWPFAFACVNLANILAVCTGTLKPVIDDQVVGPLLLVFTGPVVVIIGVVSAGLTIFASAMFLPACCLCWNMLHGMRDYALFVREDGQEFRKGDDWL